MPSLIAALQAQPEQADALMRDACARLRAWQRDTPTPCAPPGDERLRCGVAHLMPPAPAGAQAATPADAVLERLQQDAALPPQGPVLDAALPLEGSRPQAMRCGPLTDDLAVLLRPAELAWDEMQEIDWAVRHWEACRQAGLLDEELSADFGEFWRRVEWSGLRHHLRLLADGHAEERRLLAQVAKTASRYVALTPLKRALQARHPELFDLGFSLR